MYWSGAASDLELSLHHHLQQKCKVPAVGSHDKVDKPRPHKGLHEIDL